MHHFRIFPVFTLPPLNMSDSSFLRKESLFARIPPTSTSLKITINDFLHLLKNSNSYMQLIDYCYYLIVNPSFDVKQVLKLWEIRLLLLLFNNQINLAKKEAINLNNALYNHENNQPAGTLLNEVSKMNNDNALLPIYPLPKNNNGLIEYNLLILLLRLKSIPNLGLVNELYKLCYQLRLTKTSDAEIQSKLINLSYEIVVVLTITKNFLTLLSFIESILHDLAVQGKSGELTEAYLNYMSNITLIYIIINIINDNKLGKITPNNLSKVTKKYEKDFNNINQNSINCLYRVLKTISPIIHEEAKLLEAIEKLEIGDLGLAKVIGFIRNGELTGRTICSILGLWDLNNSLDCELTESVFAVNVNEECDDTTNGKIDLAYRLVTKNWDKLIYKVYCLE